MIFAPAPASVKKLVVVVKLEVPDPAVQFGAVKVIVLEVAVGTHGYVIDVLEKYPPIAPKSVLVAELGIYA